MQADTTKTTPVSIEPPFGFCRSEFSPVHGGLCWYFDGVPVISTPITKADRPHFNSISDGNLQSHPLVQQAFLALDTPVDTEVTVFLGSDSVCMRPTRAGNEEAILGQVGRPLLYSANGLYDIGRDILISWGGANWRWADTRLAEAVYDPATDRVAIAEFDDAPAGPGLVHGLAARLRVELSSVAWTLRILMRYYRDHLGYRYHEPWKRRPKLDPVTGWCSWEAYRRDVDAPKLATAVGFLKENLAPYGLEYVQVDDGYQCVSIPPKGGDAIRDSWLSPNRKFPAGHDDIHGVIAAAGLRSGIWTSAAVTNEEFARRDGNCLSTPDGEAFQQPWIGYVASCTNEFLEREIVPLYRGLAREGYEYVKADTLRHLIFDGLMRAVEDKVITNAEAESRFRAYLEAIREGVGNEPFLLSCWGVLTQAIGLCDACRIAGDANPTWGSFRMQIFESARWYHTQRILFQADPDHICARSHPLWTRSLTSLVSMSGGLYMLSDDVNIYNGERLEVIRRTIPAQPVMTAETGPPPLDKPAYSYAPGAERTGSDLSIKEALEVSAATIDDVEHHTLGSLWAVHYNVDGRSWCVAGRFGLIPFSRAGLQLNSLGLDPQAKYHAFDFWAEEYLGCVTGEIHCPPIGLGDCQVIGFRVQEDRPAYIADNRHISMGLEFLMRETWDGDTLELAVRGVPGREFCCWLAIPEGYEPIATAGEGLVPRWDEADGEPAVRVLCLAFDSESGIVRIEFGRA